MVQLNPLKWGSKKRKEKKAEKLKIEKLKKTISSTQMCRGASKRRSDAKKELNRMGHLTDKQKSQKDKKDRKKYDQEHKIINKRGRVTGYKEGYDPSKGVKGSGSTSTSSSTSSSNKSSKKVGGKKLSNYEMKVAERKAEMQKRAGAKHADWKKMRKGDMSKEDFIKKYPRSQTAKKYSKK